MSHLQYFDYKGFGERVRKDTHYSQAVRIGDRIEISGQGGWDRITEEIPTDIDKQVDQAFANVEHALQQAGGKGWEQVFKVRGYFAGENWEQAMGAAVRNLRAYCPNHQPLLTGIVVAGLYNNMALEIEVEAHLG
ncbi:YjgF-like protein [Aaosphaeria arxii CBS 175.79]|uniref:YjgF-like protein n=1 Tax=Aaosphaeria arxii CBS 175.79 TaxID=1450172 RepID=A0A6A5XNE5_9PLEO|nr:YjgF-like protein [Aaosphaeria arxii CBS 175.79]KAF2014758.1 YjgF-like protein [Aaosphaeria arxii CBS 175.79]